MADMVKNDGNDFVPNQLPPAQPQPSAPQMVQHLDNAPLHQSIAAMFNQNNAGVQEMLKGKLKALGIIQIVTGIISIIIGILLVTSVRILYYIEMSTLIGTPWWTGVLFIVAGALAVAVEKEPTQCMIKGCLSTNIISAIACLPAVIIYSGLIPCVAILLLLTLLNAAISIAVSSFNCKAMNGCCGTPVPVIVVYNSTSGQLIPPQPFQENPPPYSMAPMGNTYVG
ncbi:membrane-spanning 4-domains subfamily A member 4D-like isoform X3 [Scyliorhinus torazame]|uniref:membrane-spanning 4-domains subfamily A member 4D-like isoform X3 n=1 Tax=Scyliorhinus torazame TaxID=75743 RepID=UPI003B5A095F